MTLEVIEFDEALRRTEGEPRSLLLGNGFSIAHFKYSNLLDESGIPLDHPIRAIFRALDTFDFERVMRSLEGSALVAKAYEDQGLAEAYLADAQHLRVGLIDAIRAIHPAHKEDIEAAVPSCCRFLSSFDDIFTLNYDLLLYWVQLSLSGKFRDGFGLGIENDGFRGPFVEHAYCQVFNLHGGLHLFQNESGEMEKRVHEGSGIIEAISRSVLEDGRLPTYVAEGTSTAKMKRINSVPYLSHCYEKLKSTSGNMFVYGHSADENDRHVYAALFRSPKQVKVFGELKHVYFCVYRPDGRLDQIHGELARYRASMRSNVGYTFVDAETAKVWNGAPL